MYSKQRANPDLSSVTVDLDGLTRFMDERRDALMSERKFGLACMAQRGIYLLNKYYAYTDHVLYRASLSELFLSMRLPID